MISRDEHHELTRDASALAYQAIRFTGLYRELAGSEWDRLADQIASEVVDQVERRCEAAMEEFANAD